MTQHSSASSVHPEALVTNRGYLIPVALVSVRQGTIVSQEVPRQRSFHAVVTHFTAQKAVHCQSKRHLVAKQSAAMPMGCPELLLSFARLVFTAKTGWKFLAQLAISETFQVLRRQSAVESVCRAAIVHLRLPFLFLALWATIAQMV